MSAKDEGKGYGRSDGDDLGKTNDFNRTRKRPCEKLRPHNINKVDKKHQQ
jgi:hypothetical protein